MTTSATIVVWDQSKEPPVLSGLLVHWRRYDQHGRISSIPRYLEEHADRLKKKYLAFIHDLGEYRMQGKRLVDHLDMGDGFSFWWMSLLAEKSPFKSPRIYDCLRIFALEEILLSHRPATLTLVSADEALVEAMSRLCLNLGIGFIKERSTEAGTMPGTARRIYEVLPSWLQGLLSLRHILRRWALRKLGIPKWHSGANDLFFCSYFIHLDQVRCAQGVFYSRHWEGLPRLLHDCGRHTNWLQLFLTSKVVPDVATGISWVARFNCDTTNQGTHAFLDTYLTPKRMIDAMRLWFRLGSVKWRLWKVQSAFQVNGSAVWLWPMLRDDWRSSFNGPAALTNCLNVVLFEGALGAMPRQTTGLYLFENQAWEKALLRAWRRHHHGEIIGVQHATVPYWHLYYFDDPRSLQAGGKCPMPLPDRIAVNGEVAWKAFAEGGYPTETLVEVEALRYLYLGNSTANDAGRQSPTRSRRNNPEIRVLIVGDIIPASMNNVLRLLQDALPSMRDRYSFTFKPHPGYAVNLGAFPGLKLTETVDTLANLLGHFDIALAANSTSAAVDAYIAGLPVIVAVDGATLNLSPLLGRPGAYFASTPLELASALKAAADGLGADARRHDDFFFLSGDLPRWKRLLTDVRAG